MHPRIHFAWSYDPGITHARNQLEGIAWWLHWCPRNTVLRYQNSWSYVVPGYQSYTSYDQVFWYLGTKVTRTFGTSYDQDFWYIVRPGLLVPSAGRVPKFPLLRMRHYYQSPERQKVYTESSTTTNKTHRIYCVICFHTCCGPCCRKCK